MSGGIIASSPSAEGSCESSTLSLEAVVALKSKTIPLTGSYSIDTEIPGWSWDRRLLQDSLEESSLYLGSVGGQLYNLDEGLRRSDWVSGSISGVEFASLKEYKVSNYRTSWTPIITAGIYSVHDKVKRLYSDYSFTKNIEDNGHDFPSIILRSDALLDTVSVVMYNRDSKFTNWPYKEYLNTKQFTGKLVEELVSSNSIKFENNTDLITLGDKEAFTFNNGQGVDEPFSISAWVKIEDVSTSAGGFFSKRNAGNAEGEYYFGHEEGELIAILYADGAQNGIGAFVTMNRINVRVAPGGLQDQTWHNITVTYDGSKDSSGISIYLDGALQTPSVSSNLNYNGMGNEDAQTCIGGTENPEGNTFEDYIADVVVFSKCLTNWECSEVYNSGSIKDMNDFSRKDKIISWYKMGDDLDAFTTDPALPVAEGIRDYISDNHGTILGSASHSIETPASDKWVYRKLSELNPLSLSERHNEYTLSAPDINNQVELRINNKGFKLVGDFVNNAVPSAEDLHCLLEHKGKGNPKGRDCYTDYFPLSTNSVRVFVHDTVEDTVEEWSEVENLSLSNPFDKHFSVDYDLGIITLGGYTAPDVFLKETVQADTTLIKVLAEENHFDAYPDEGVLQIENELIKYSGKGYKSFNNCIRGFSGTNASHYDLGEKVKDYQSGFGCEDSSEIYIGYKAIPRVQYEVDQKSSSYRSANSSSFIDLKAVKNSTASGILQINPKESHVASLELSVDSSPMGGNIYGPIYYGTDFARLVAAAFDSGGMPQANIKTTIVLESTTGSLNGFNRDFTDITNSLGRIYSIYNTPYDWDSVSKNVRSVEYDAGSNETSINLLEEVPANTDMRDITLFQVLKHDKSMGSIGTKYQVISLENGQSFSSGQELDKGATLIIDAVFDDAASRWESQEERGSQGGWNGPAHLMNSSDLHCSTGEPNVDTARYGLAYVDITFLVAGAAGPTTIRRKIFNAMDNYEDANGVQTKVSTSLILDKSVTDDLINSQVLYCRAVEKDMRVWSPSTDQHLAVVLYEWTNNATHPLTQLPGAYSPVRPDSANLTTLTFADRELPIPDKDDPENNLGKYLVVSPDMVSLYAYCKDPVSGREIRSNKIRLRLNLPAYLRGVDNSDVLPVPYGFGLVTEDFNLGGGLGGSNFLTINPSSQGVDRFNINIDANIE